MSVDLVNPYASMCISLERFGIALEVARAHGWLPEGAVEMNEYDYDDACIQHGFERACDQQISRCAVRAPDYGNTCWKVVTAVDGRRFAAALQVALTESREAAPHPEISQELARTLICMFALGPVVIS